MPKFKNIDEKTGKQKGITIGIRITSTQKEKLEYIAKEQGHTLSSFLRYQIKKIIEEYENQRK